MHRCSRLIHHDAARQPKGLNAISEKGHRFTAMIEQEQSARDPLVGRAPSL